MLVHTMLWALPFIYLHLKCACIFLQPENRQLLSTECFQTDKLCSLQLVEWWCFCFFLYLGR